MISACQMALHSSHLCLAADMAFSMHRQLQQAEQVQLDASRAGHADSTNDDSHYSCWCLSRMENVLGQHLQMKVRFLTWHCP